MAGSKQSSVLVDLTLDDGDSLSELSDASPSSPAKTKAKSKSASTSTSLKKASAVGSIKKSASSTALGVKSPMKAKSATAAAANGTAKPKARKSEPIPNKSTAADADGTSQESSKPKPKRKQADRTQPKASSSRSAPISDIVRARTHVNCQGNPIKICHQHHQPCKGPLLECTFMRAPGKRCQGRYCFSSLKRFYGQDPEATVKSNRIMINPEEHCSPTETKYAWKCPRCRGKCDCSTCRKAKGLEPLGKWTGPKKGAAAGTSAGENGKAAEGDAPKNKGKAKAKTDQADIVGEVESAAKGKAKGNIAQATAAAGKQSGKGKGKSSTTAIDVDAADEDDGISTPPPPAGASSTSKSATTNKKTLASILGTTSVQAPVFKPLKPPTAAPPPTFQVIPTKLPEDNMRARMWIYESMIRFDKFGLNRGVLSQLDKFESWTHAMVQDMLACLLKTIAGLSNIEKGQPTKPFVKAITAYRTHGKSLQRGEPWSAATELLTVLGLETTPLPYVEHDVPVQVEAAAAQRSPSPPVQRVTRGRRAKENKQYEIARQLSMLDQWEEDEFGEAQSDGNGYDEDDAPSNKRRRASTKKSIYVYDDPSDDESMADPDDSSRGRRSGRARKPVHKEPAPEVRLTGRQQAIKLQQEQQKEEEAKQRQEEEEAHESSRKRRASANGVNGGGGSHASDLSDDEDAEEKAHTNGHSQKKRRRLTAGSSGDDDDDDDDLDTEKQEKDDADTKSNGAVEEKEEQDQREQESPDLETKISILSSLIDAAVMADSIAEELKTASDNIVALERSHRTSNAELEKELGEELAELNKRAPSIVSPEYQKWKAEKAELEVSIAWRRLDARVINELAIDTHALRTGPLGYDADGREYWHLREYQERMPKYTEGRYAWCLVVLGKAFPVDPNQPKDEKGKEEEEKKEEDVSMTDAEPETKKEAATGDDSGLTSIDGTSESGKADVDTESTLLGLAKSAMEGTNSVDAATSDKRICMGANDPATIKKLIDYVTFRLDQIEYQENVSMQERDKAIRLAKDGGESRAASPSADDSIANGATESMYSIRKAKQTLKETQEERRKQVKVLVKRLNKSKEYFAWHRDEVPP